jgi:uracil-DNA glycosylase
VIGRSALRALFEEYSHCEACDLLCQSRVQPVFGSGSASARIVYVGEAPGAEDDDVGLPFVGPSGRLLLQLFEKSWWACPELDLIRQIEDNDTFFEHLREYLEGHIFFTNAVMCRPEDDRTPSAKEVKECRQRLHQTIYAIDPTLIIAGGKVAATALLGKNVNIMDRRGGLMDIPIISPATGQPVRYAMLPTLSAGFLLQKGDGPLVQEGKGHTYETIQDLSFGLSIISHHKTLVRSH